MIGIRVLLSNHSNQKMCESERDIVMILHDRMQKLEV